MLTMALREVLVIVAFSTLVLAIDSDDIEQKKRGVGTSTGVNAIPTAVQKPEYTYSVYSQSPNKQNLLASHYQGQIPNSFYPTQANQYYNPTTTNDGATAHTSQPSANVGQQSATQFVPLNFVPHPGYQAKYQTLPSKLGNGHIQMVLQPSAGIPSSNYHFPQSVYSPATNAINAHTNPLLTSITPHGHFNFPTNYQPLAIGSPYLGHSPTVLFPQLNAPFYSNLLYSNPGQNFYYPSNIQPKQNFVHSSQASTSNEYDKLQASTSQSSSKDENDIAAQSSDLVHTELIPAYKSTYTSGRSSAYSKLK